MMRAHPHLYEINSRVYLKRLQRKSANPLTLSGIPEKEWQGLSDLGFDLIWMMGVWQVSPESKRKAMAEPSLREAYQNILPDWKSEDVGGSPYAVYSYHLNPELGQEKELQKLRKKLNDRGLKLILDFVPNHLACDHPWTKSHPGRFVRVSAETARRYPEWFFSPSEGVYLAHGRDPYFPAWTDTVQINLFSKETRHALTGELLRIASQCDGVRCDMAMLLLSDVFEGVWGNLIKEQRPEEEFWAEAIERVRRDYPHFIFMAEAYWNHEWRLQQLGFDFTYDKIFYDRLKEGQVKAFQEHLQASPVFQQRCVHFLENHDESRAAEVFGKERLPAALAVLGTLPGLRFYQDGQLEGKKIRLPVQFVREPAEPKDPEILKIYEQILRITNEPIFHEGEWRLLQAVPAWKGNWTYENFLIWIWTLGRDFRLIAVNFSPARSQARILMPFPYDAQKSFALYDEWCDETYVREQHDLVHHGLYMDRHPWGVHVLKGTW